MYFRKKGNKWYFTIYITDQYGRRKKLERVGGRTRAEAKQKAKEMIKEEDHSGVTFIDKKMTFHEYADFWFHDYAELNLSPGTQYRYQRALEDITAKLGDTDISQITSFQLQAFLNTMKKDGYARSTIGLYKSIMATMFRLATVEYEFLHQNPAQKLQVPRSGTLQKQTRIFSAQDMDEILTFYNRGKDLYIPICLSYHLGLRAGECLALSWDDVNFEANTVHVCKTMCRNGKDDIILNRTKNKKSRTIVMDTAIMEILRQQKKDQDTNRTLYRSYYVENNLVCTKADGSPLRYTCISGFNSFCKRHHIDGSFHGLRHTHATMLIQAGLDLDYVSKRLGHSSIGITSGIYVHTTKQREEKAKKIMEKIFQT